MINLREISMLIIGMLLITTLFILKLKPEALLGSSTQPLTARNQSLGSDTSDLPLVYRPTELTALERKTKPAELINIAVPSWQLPNQTNLSEITAADYIVFTKQAINDGRLFEPENQNALYYINLARKVDATHPQINEQLIILKSALSAMANQAISTDDMQQLSFVISRLKNIDSDDTTIPGYVEILNNATTITQLLDLAESQLNENILYNQSDDDAWHLLKQAEEIEPNHPRLASLQNDLIRAFSDLAIRAAQESDFEMANVQIELARQTNPAHEKVIETAIQIDEIQQQRFAWLDEQFYAAIESERIPRAQQMIDDLARLNIAPSQLNEYNKLLEKTKLYGPLEPYAVFQESIPSLGVLAPKMIVMPTGQFMMGSKDGKNAEQPEHLVNINYGFAVGTTEITVQEFAHFIQSSNYQTSAQIDRSAQVYDINSGRFKNKTTANWREDYTGKRAEDDLPVIHVSWNDAQAYVEWLAQQTGRPYRLLSEAEFEFVLRAGNNTLYPWGDQAPNSVIGNFSGKEDRLRQSRARWKEGFDGYNDGYWGPAPTGSFIPNLYGVYDMSGNVVEWVKDCWHDSYVRAPTDGSAWYNPGCADHVVRGGSWSSQLFEYQSQHRYKASKAFNAPRLGFRVALTLTR